MPGVLSMTRILAWDLLDHRNELVDSIIETALPHPGHLRAWPLPRQLLPGSRGQLPRPAPSSQLHGGRADA